MTTTPAATATGTTAVEELAGREPGLAALVTALTRHGGMVVAFSGGADSALLAFVAHAVLGQRCVCATAVSPSLASSELADVRQLAAQWDLDLVELPTDELEDPAYVRNGVDRCYHCKSALLRAVSPLAAELGATVALGVNVDDLVDHRPGQLAAAEAGAVFPLVEASLDKAEVRRLSRLLGLRTWDKPAAACLASRLPHGTAVTIGTLAVVAAAESAVRALGFRQVRVRHYGELARIELPLEDVERAVILRTQVVAAVKDAGYHFVTLDLEGFRSGSLNPIAGGQS